MATARFDFILYGATSFVGKIIAHYLINEHSEREAFEWAIAGRSPAKLNALKESLGTKAASLPIIVADATENDALLEMVKQTQVVISTVGPYALYGEALVKLCAETGTDYCDLTGEVFWIQRMLAAYESKAKQNGARIVHCCGFDSIPFDMGVYFLQQEAVKRFGKACHRVSTGVKQAKGGLSGGTLASMLNGIQEAVNDPLLRKSLTDPYILCPAKHAYTVRQKNISVPIYDSNFDAWLAPFIMSAINTRIIHRSNALFQNRYTEDFYYTETLLFRSGIRGRLKATLMTSALAGFLFASAFKPSRYLLEHFVFPQPGEGPSDRTQEQGYFDLRMIGFTDNDQRIKVSVKGDRDPGYGSTARMIAQAGLCLAKDISDNELPGGFWTPSTAFGFRLLTRLKKFAGIEFNAL